MGWIRRSAGDLHAWQDRRPVSVILTAAGAVVASSGDVAGGDSVTVVTSTGNFRNQHRRPVQLPR